MESVFFVACASMLVPFYALYITNDDQLSSFTKSALIYTPAQLAVKPKYDGEVEIKIGSRGAYHGR